MSAKIPYVKQQMEKSYKEILTLRENGAVTRNNTSNYKSNLKHLAPSKTNDKFNNDDSSDESDHVTTPSSNIPVCSKYQHSYIF